MTAELQVQRDYLAARAALLTSGAAPGEQMRSSLAETTDRWLTGLFNNAGGDGLGAALVAWGGYGRRELAPGSDLDVLLLLPSNGDEALVQAMADRIWYPIWDSGIQLDHSVKTPAQVRRTATEDLRTLLGMLDSRHLAGDARLVMALRQTVLADWRAAALRRLPELGEQTRERAARAGDLAHLLEPDLKESYGGLRDLTVLRAISASWVVEVPHGEQVEHARATLLNTRDSLHRALLATGSSRTRDRLMLQDQDATAAGLGLLDADVLLRQVSAAGRTISYCSDLAWHRVERLVRAGRGSRRSRLPLRRLLPGGVDATRRPLADGVVEHDGEVVLAEGADPGTDSLLVLRAAAAAAQAGLRLSPHTLTRLADCPPLPIPWPAPARESLVSLLGAGEAALPVWEALDQAGLVQRLLPDWARVRSRPQRNPVHRYTVDRHLVQTAVLAAADLRQVQRPDLLLVGALLHDIGKGWPGDHTVAGTAVVADLAPRLGFSAADSAVLVRLVQHHLLLPNTATRRDLEDPATVSLVADAVVDAETLDLLHALVKADAAATGPAAWSDWKEHLIDDLVRRTHASLSGEEVPRGPGFTPAQYALAGADTLEVVLTKEEFDWSVIVAAPDKVGLLADVAGVLATHRLAIRAASTLTMRSPDPGQQRPVALTVWKVTPEFGEPPAVSVLREDVRRVLDGTLDISARLARREAASKRRPGLPVAPPRVSISAGASAHATVLEVRAHDEPGLLHRIATALTAAGANVSRALVSTLGSEAVDVFYLLGPDEGALEPEAASKLLRRVRDALV